MGYGDEIMASAEVRLAKKKFPTHQIVIGNNKPYTWAKEQTSIFQNNPHITPVDKINYKQPIHYIHNYPGNRPYINNKLSDSETVRFNKQFKAIKGDIFLSPQENKKLKELKNNYSDYILLHPAVKKTFIKENKDWGLQNWQELCDLLVGQGQKIIECTNTLKNASQETTNSFRDMCLLISACKLVVTTEGGIHHAAGALRKNAVVIFGGRTSPETHGYDSHINIYIETPESPCGKIKYCEHCEICMKCIKPEKILAKINKLL